MNGGGDFALYVKRVGIRRFRVSVYLFDTRGEERFVVSEFVRTLWRKRALRAAKKLADAYWLDQVKCLRSVAILTLSQPTEKIRIVPDDSPEARK